jgi:hypothetical protein
MNPSNFPTKASSILIAFVIAFLSTVNAQHYKSLRSVRHDSVSKIGIQAKTNSKLMLNGGYIEYWNNMLDRPKAEWESVLGKMREVKMTTVILKHLVYKESLSSGGNEHSFIVPKEASKSSELGATDPTKLILEYADGKDHAMDVYVGLWEDQNWSESTFNVDYLKDAKKKNIELVKRISALYGDHPSFKGWYITLEPWNFVDPGKAVILNDFIKAVSAECRKEDKKRNKKRQIAIAAYFNMNLASPEETEKIYSEKVLKNAGIDILLLQDSIAVNGWNEDKNPVLSKYFEKFRAAANKNGAQFWALVENFEPGHRATTIERIKEQFRAEKDYASTFITFEYYHYMNPLVSGIPLAPQNDRLRLYNEYKRDFVDQDFKP